MSIARILFLFIILPIVAGAQTTISGSGAVTGSGSIGNTPFVSGSNSNLSFATGWHKIQFSQLQGAENTSPCPPNNFGGYGYNFHDNCGSVMNAWSGAVADTLRSRLVFWGGGHTDYSGNELYALDLNKVGTCTANDPCLYRLNNPSPPATSGSPNALADGRPNSDHTYQGIIYVPTWAPPASTSTVNGSDVMVVNGGCPAVAGCGALGSWQLNMASVAGECAPVTTNSCGTSVESISQWTSLGGPANNADNTMVWDATNQRALLINSGGNVLSQYTVGSGTFSNVNTTALNIGGFNSSSAEDDFDQILFFMGNGAFGQAFWITTVSGASIVEHDITFDGSCPSAIFPSDYPPLVWDPIEKAFRVLNISNYSQQYLVYPNLASSTWSCVLETYGSVQSTDYPQPNGSQMRAVLGKWNYFANLDVFVLCNDPAADCWYFRPIRPGINITNTTAGTLNSVVISQPQIFRQGDVPQFASAVVDGVPVATTQTDVRNRWPDGSLKLAQVSYVISSIAAGKTVHARYANQATGNNTGQLTPAQMLSTSAPNWNFDGQVQLSGTVPHNLSARTILQSANSGSGCADATGSDPDGALSQSGVLCAYWMKGPVVTSVILEDRFGRTADVNIDGSSGTPLHPRFEATFYPASTQVVLGYTLENDWASTTSTSSARNQTLGVTFTGGSSSPATLATNASFLMRTRTLFHKAFCIVGTGAGGQWDCNGSNLHIDHRWTYMAKTKGLPNYNPYDVVQSATISGLYSGLFSNTSALPIQGCTTCFSGGGGVGNYPNALDATGASGFHGIVPTWDSTYLVTQCDAGNSTSAICGNGIAGDLRAVSLTNADLAGLLPYWYREADQNSGNGQTFDNSGTPGNVKTLGRVISINARTQISLSDVTGTVNQCNTNFPADYINFGGSGQDAGPFDNGTSHWPNVSLVSYLTLGHYHYYEMQMQQSAYALGVAPGTRACTQPTQNGSLRMASAGYYLVDDERETEWQERENLYGSFWAVDNSPEKAYFIDKMKANFAIYEALHGIANDVGTAYTTAYNYGLNSPRCNGVAYCPVGRFGPLGVWNAYSPAYTQAGQGNGIFFASGSGHPAPQSSVANFQAAFSGVLRGMEVDMGLAPSSNILSYTTRRYIHTTMDPTANIFTLSDYVFPTTDVNGNWLTDYTSQTQFYLNFPTHWPGIGGGTCQGGDEPYSLEGMAALSYGTTFSDAGFSAAAGYRKMRSGLMPCILDVSSGFNNNPKWDIIPR
jgi:hypothetical protein